MNPEAEKVVTGDAEEPKTPPPASTASPTPTDQAAPVAGESAPKPAEAKPMLTPEQEKEILDRARAAGKAAAEKIKAARAELAAIIGHGRDYETAAGYKVKIPPMDGLREKRALQVLLNFLANHEDILSQFGAGDLSGGGIVKVLLANISGIYDEAVHFVSVLTDLSEEEIVKHLVFGDLLEVISPFLALQAGTIQTVIQTFLPMAMNLRRGRRASPGTPGAFGSALRN